MSIITSAQTLEIYFNDLNADTQHNLCCFWNTEEQEENWETMPLFILNQRQE